MSYLIPFNKPPKMEQGFAYLQEVLNSEKHSGDGKYTALCHRRLQELTGAQHVLLTTSCTHALEMSALLLDIQPGDEVIVPSFTFVSTANAFALRGAQIIFADIRPDTLNLDEQHVARLVSDRTKAIVPVHYAGVGCNLTELCALARSRNIGIVEDTAHGLTGKYRGRLLGSFGDLATLSFHETKNFSCGEGGALLINNQQFIHRAEIIREKGTDRSRFFRGQVDKYSWVDLGSSFLPSDLLAAWLYAQLERASEIQTKRSQIWHRYQDGLKDWALPANVRLPICPAECEQAYHMFYLLMPDLSSRQRLILFLKERGILAVFHYLPLHLSTMGHKFGGKVGDCPVTEWVSDRLVRLPFFHGLTEDEQELIIREITQFSI